MDNTEKTIEVVENAEKSRFDILVDGALAGFADLERDGDVVTIPHTEVDPAFGGQGIGGKLVAGTLEALRREGVRVVPQCPFVAGWIGKHPDYQDLVAHD